MFKQIFIFELKQWLKRPAIYIYFSVFIGLAFFIGAAASGMLSGVTSDTNTFINSSVALSQILTSFNSDYLFGLITILISVAIMAPSVQKDFQHNSFAFYFTKPISKFSYLFARFSASFLLTAFVLFGIILGIIFAYSIGHNDNGQFGEFRFFNFLEPFLLFLLPNAFFIGTLFFCLVTFTRNMTSGYVGSLVFVVVIGIARSIISDIENKHLAAILDPFGTQALEFVTEYWTPSEINSRLVPFTSYILYNRLVWMCLSFGLLIFTYKKFSFNQFLNPVSIFKRKAREGTSQPSKIIQSIGHLPKVTQSFDFKLSWMQLKFLTKFEFSKITRSVFFYIIVGLSILLTVVVTQFSGLIYGTSTHPLTYMQIESATGGSTFFQLIMIVFYSGIVIWRERDSKVDELVGSTPVKNGVLFLSKLVSLVSLGLLLNFICILTCICIQSFKGYTNFEFGLYFKDLILLKILSLTIVCGLGMVIQVFFKNRYFGFFAMAFILLGIPVLLNVFNYDNDLIQFNSSGNLMRYSDMNGHGHTMPNYFIYKGYWIGFMLMFAALAIAMYQRGREQKFSVRLKQAIATFRFPYKLVALTGLLFFIGCGSIIYYNTRVLNPYKSPKEVERETADFEKNYKKYQNEAQPRIVASNVNVDIFPDELGFKVKGFYYLKNKHKKPVLKIFVNSNPSATNYFVEFDVKNKRFLNDTAMGFAGYELSEELQPGDSIKMDFGLDVFPKNFIIKKGSSQVVGNGSFFNNGYFPSIGYSSNSELSDNSTRKKYKLPPKPRMANIRDSSFYNNTYISDDADWIRFECIVSTKEGQIAIAPGYLQKEWKGSVPFHGEARHYFQYKMDAPILNFYSFNSASYQVKKEAWKNPLDKSNDVNIEIYYQKGHEYNIDKMIQSIKKSLNYYTKNFSPYQHKQVRILEFPRYASFAQSFPNTIPFSESIGFVAKLDEKDPNQVDFVFYVTAHEVAHQWWAHQAIGANVQGCTVMSETMSQYSALMVMEKEYGRAAMSKFMRYEMNKYLQARQGEGKKEVPLLLCENQQYIHYNKGSVIMYSLKDYLGEDTLNAALSRYIKKVGYQEPPYTTALQFYDFIKNATPDSLKETLADMFERIVVYENSVKNWSYKKTADGKYKVTATVTSIKTQSDSLGKAKEVKPSNWFDFGVFAKNLKNPAAEGEVLFLKKIKVTNKEQTFEVVVDKEPYLFGIDPYNKIIDKDTGDNIKDINGKNVGVEADPLSGVVIKSE